MAHQEDLARLRDQLGERACHNAGLDLGVTLRFLRSAAVEGEVVPVLDDRLISAARKRHLNGEHGIIIVFLERGAVFSDAK